MAMSTNVEIGERLRLERQRCQLTQLELADVAGVSKTTQVNYEGGHRSPDATYLLAVSKVGVDVSYVVTGVRIGGGLDEGFVVIPVLPAQASVGPGALNEPDGHHEVGGLCFSRQWLAGRKFSPANLRVIAVHGDSMDPTLSDGDQVLIDLSDVQPRGGGVYVLRQGEELLVKHCQLLPGGTLRVSGANEAYQPYDVDLAKTPDVQIVGRVVASMHDW